MEALGQDAVFVKADPMTGETSVPGVYAAGDAGPPPQSVVVAAASGAGAAAFLNHVLCGEDAEAEIASAGNLARRTG